MDKYEYKVKTEQMLEYMENKQYDKAMEIADTIDWRRVKNASMLNSVSEIYEQCKEYQKSRDVLYIAFDRSPTSRKIMYRLALLALKVNEVEEASDCYDEFVKLAPRDPNQYILKYKILRTQGSSINEQIGALEELKKAEYVERWAYELAELYDKAGMTTKCIEECDDLILWFSEGKYVYKAMELKMKYKPLTPMQQDKYDTREGAKKTFEMPEAPKKEPTIEELDQKASDEDTVEDVAEETGDEEPEAEAVEEHTEEAEVSTPVSGIPLEEDTQSMKEKDEELKASGQMKIEDILAEWEEKQKENAAAIKAQREIDKVRLDREKKEAEVRIAAERKKVEEAIQEERRKQEEEKAKRQAIDNTSPRDIMDELDALGEEEDFEDYDMDTEVEIINEFDDDEELEIVAEDNQEEDTEEDFEDFEEEILEESEDLEDFEEGEELEVTEEPEEVSSLEEDDLELAPAEDIKEVEDDFDEDDFWDAEEDFDEEYDDDFEEDFEEDDFAEEEFEEEIEEADFEEEALTASDYEEEAEEEEEELDLELELARAMGEPTEEEIQKRIKTSKGGVPFDTGFVVTGRYDLSATSEIGLKAGLTEEQKKLFSYFVPVRGMSEQIVEVLDNDRRARKEGTSKTGNLLIVGRKGSGKTVLAVDIVKAIQKQRNLKQGKVAIVTGDSLNKKELTNIIQKLKGGAIIIEKAGKLNSRTIKELNMLMDKKTGELLFVLEDQRKPLERILTANPEFRKKFTSRLELPIFINDELVTFGQTYAKENGYKLDEMGILALYSRIDAMQREDHAVTVAEVKEIMDEAIDHSQKANVKHLARRVFGKSTDGSDRIILKEEDFKL
ncbi:hypothetical protein M2454_000016 [Aequitasia blattaphilus]|uniref:AAA+ ATPase domain-containing protein n=1 Tax=Aequitasia blattaphilus TaxID=2949332 RepID=A0ABT1E4P5_9FIRM|nr:hypothetical protein [Aequitasia blattaphilus]MCP1100810.1 hypothetical protein [Aequitasia blattaphilus]MCR8613450.1 hypothetical protein [Aequitasia blattaphilus]